MTQQWSLKTWNTCPLSNRFANNFSNFPLLNPCNCIMNITARGENTISGGRGLKCGIWINWIRSPAPAERRSRARLTLALWCKMPSLSLVTRSHGGRNVAQAGASVTWPGTKYIFPHLITSHALYKPLSFLEMEIKKRKEMVNFSGRREVQFRPR